MAVCFAGASGGSGAVLRKTIGMRSALLCAYSAEELFIMEQCRAVCGPPGIAFSRVGSWRKTASAALVSCGNSRAAGRTLSGSRRSPAVPLSGFAIFPRSGEVVPLRGSFLPSVGQRERSSPFGGAGAGAPERVYSLPLGELASRSDDWEGEGADRVQQRRFSFSLDISPLLHYNTSKMNHSKMKG